jgi:hypothetical protein
MNSTCGDIDENFQGPIYNNKWRSFTKTVFTSPDSPLILIHLSSNFQEYYIE